jgi:hypothetical protein
VGYASRRQSGVEFALDLGKRSFGTAVEGKRTRLWSVVKMSRCWRRTGPVISNRSDGTIDVMIVFPGCPDRPYGYRPLHREEWDDAQIPSGMGQILRRGDYLRFSDNLFKQAHRIIATTGSVFVFAVHNNLGLIDLAVRRAGLKVLHHVVWVKRNAAPVLSIRRLQFSHETIIWCVGSTEMHSDRERRQLSRDNQETSRQSQKDGQDAPLWIHAMTDVVANPISRAPICAHGN